MDDELHTAAKNGQLDECRRLVVKEGNDVNGTDIVSICMMINLNISHTICEIFFFCWHSTTTTKHEVNRIRFQLRQKLHTTQPKLFTRRPSTLGSIASHSRDLAHTPHLISAQNLHNPILASFLSFLGVKI
jgi:hypothetical protein